MRPLFVITLQPCGGDFPHLIQRLEYVSIEHFGAIGAIEAFNERMLIGLARLDIPQLNTPVLTPGHKPVGDQLWAIVEANRLRPSPPGHHLFQDAHHSLCGQRRIHFDGQALPHAFIENIERAESSSAIQGHS